MSRLSPAPQAWFTIVNAILGLTPQALCRRPLRGLAEKAAAASYRYSMTRKLSTLLLLSLAMCSPVYAPPAHWRAASEAELRKIIPARAPVIKENIETEFRTASGVTDGRKFIAGVVMITAGYSAEGKYSHFMTTQVALKVGDLDLQPGDYVFGYQRKNADTIDVAFYRAASGESVGSVEAHVNRKSAMVRSLLISPPVRDKGTIQVGRFLFDYRLVGT